MQKKFEGLNGRAFIHIAVLLIEVARRLPLTLRFLLVAGTPQLLLPYMILYYDFETVHPLLRSIRRALPRMDFEVVVENEDQFWDGTMRPYSFVFPLTAKLNM